MMPINENTIFILHWHLQLCVLKEHSAVHSKVKTFVLQIKEVQQPLGSVDVFSTFLCDLLLTFGFFQIAFDI